MELLKRFEFVINNTRERLIKTWVVPDPETKIGNADHALLERWNKRSLFFLWCAGLISTIDSLPITLSSHRMVKNGICKLPAWKIYKHVLNECGFLEVVPFVGTDFAIRHYAIGELHSGTNPGWGGVAVRWTVQTVRYALQKGYFEIKPYPLPDSEPPELSIERGTQTQWEQYAQMKQQVQLQQATIDKRVSVPVLPENTPKTQPAQPASPQWLMDKGDLLWTKLSAKRYDVRIESAKLYGDSPVFLLYFRQATEAQVDSLKYLMAECVGVNKVSTRFALGNDPGSLYAWVSA